MQHAQRPAVHCGRILCGIWLLEVILAHEGNVSTQSYAPAIVSNLDWELFQNRGCFWEAFCASLGLKSTCCFLMVAAEKTPYWLQREQ